MGASRSSATWSPAAKGRSALEAAIPTSKQIAELAETGLAALDAIEADRTPAPVALDLWRSQLATLDRQEAASLRPMEALFMPQPPADLIIKLGPGLHILVDRAAAR